MVIHRFQSKMQMQKVFTLVDLCWCHISPWEASTVLPSSLCPSSEMPENVISTKINSYQSTVKWISLTALARKELRVYISSSEQFCTNFHMCSPLNKNHGYTYPVGIIVQNHKVSVTNIESRQVITSVLGIKNVFIDHISCSSSFRCIPPAELNQT